MLIFSRPLPLSLYIHIPWCVRKCPYCDFNSHQAQSSLPEDLYVAALLQELDSRLPLIQNRPLKSIFFGGGTPSLFSAQAIGGILEGVAKRIAVSGNLEVTLEANPGTIDQPRFRGFRAAGINRLSLGIQSLQDEKLRILGRIHDRASAIQAVARAKEAGFRHFNLDIMYGLPDQSLEDARQDIQTALDLAPTHFSWYQLTLEPNTAFYRQPPPLPSDDAAWEMQLAGQQILSEAGFRQYEVSAYSLPRQECAHNRNYWEFGDYLGIGAGAHGKLTEPGTGRILRRTKLRHPAHYLEKAGHPDAIAGDELVAAQDLPVEFLMNHLRLREGFPITRFGERTGLPVDALQPALDECLAEGLLEWHGESIRCTDHGWNFLDNVLTRFLR